MKGSLILGLLQNTAILFAIGWLYDYLWARDEGPKRVGLRVLTGCILGGVGIILMLTPWTMVPGLVFDTRSVMLSIAGLFFGPVPTVTAMMVTGAFRAYMGGPGMWMGIAVVITSGTTGLLWRRFRPGRRQPYPLIELLALGLTVHLIMLACTVFLPAAVRLQTLETIAIPVLTIYPVGTMLLGALMIQRAGNWQTRKALATSEERWKFALEGAGDGVWDWNLETGRIFYSRRWKEMLGYRNEEISNDPSTWEELLHPDDRMEVLRSLQQHIDSETGEYMQTYRLKCRDGSYKWIMDRGKVMVRDEHGFPVRFIGTHTDITDRKRTEEELSKAKEKAEESDRLKMSFLNNISHEIRTPMNAILGFSSLLGEELPVSKKEAFIRIIQANSEQLLGIIDDVLEFSRLETEQLPVERSPIFLEELSQTIVSTMQPLATRKGLKLNLALRNQNGPTSFSGDRSRILQILTNLISNAIKYTPSGEVGLEAELLDSTVVFTVWDTGIGVQEEYRDKIFERFYRVPAAQEMAARGTGLGLSIVKQLVELMGGSIHLNSRLPHGTEFMVRLPAGMSQGSLGDDQPYEVPADLSDLHILVAEDEEDNYEYIRVLLEKKVRRMTHAKTGKEVLFAVKNDPPDLILMDLKMPGMNGYQAAREITGTHPNIPVVALSAYSQPEEKRKATEAGCIQFVSKPISKRLLFETLGKALTG